MEVKHILPFHDEGEAGKWAGGNPHIACPTCLYQEAYYSDLYQSDISRYLTENIDGGRLLFPSHCEKYCGVMVFLVGNELLPVWLWYV